MQDKIITNEPAPKTLPVFGVDEMLNTIGNTPLHSFTPKEIEDYGELCDQDCQDCD